MTGLQEYVRNHCRLAKEFQAKVENDSRFRLMNEVKVKRIISIIVSRENVKVGLVCFRLFGSRSFLYLDNSAFMTYSSVS